jgi:myosin heavy subunit
MHIPNTTKYMCSLILDTIYDALAPHARKLLDSDVEKRNIGLKHIRQYLGNCLQTFQTNRIEPRFVRQIFRQVFFFLNASIFNEIILRRDLCSSTKGMDIKIIISGLEEFCKRADTKEWLLGAAKELEPSKQVASVLLITNKTILSTQEGRSEVCHSISPLQLKQLLSNYQPGDFEEPVSRVVVESIVKLPNFSIEDPLCFDGNTVLPIEMSMICEHSLSDLKKTEIPEGLKAELESLHSKQLRNISNQDPTKPPISTQQTIVSPTPNQQQPQQQQTKKGWSLFK